MSSLSPAIPGLRLADGPYPERVDPDENAFDRWLSSAYARWFMPARLFAVRAHRFADRVESHESKFARCNDVELSAAGVRLSLALRRRGFRDEIVAEAFALVRELSGRVLGMRHYRVQMMAGLALLRGCVAEMHTGEGKTLAATLPAAVAAMAGIPTHILTVNDYLAKRDAEIMEPLFHRLGLSVGVVQGGMAPQARRTAYAADITYCTNKELGFDYLKDRIALKEWPSASRMTVARLLGGEDQSQGLLLRGLHFAIVDEADSILVDEARTPLIISGQEENQENLAALATTLELAKSLDARDFQLAKEDRSIHLTRSGKAKLQHMTQDVPVAGRVEMMTQALAALHLYEKDKHYLVRDDAVQIVDEFTGRLMPDRSWEMGLHQLIEIKEGCKTTGRRTTLARVTYQRLFRRYLRLSGMTGTAREITDELWSVYRLRVCRIPTHRPVQRRSLKPRLLASEQDKWRAVADAVRTQSRDHGRPVLVGTRSVEASEKLSELLAEAGIAHQVLNARQDADEAQLIAEAGQRSVVTVATNMAGRGTDIKLGAGVAEQGGLHVIITEYSEAGRIDRQLYGRSGRQGDPGSYEAIVALDDELFRVFAPSWLGLLPWARPGSRWSVGIWRRVAQSRAERHHALLRRQTLEIDRRIDRMLAFTGRE
ncbi:preprotein translocase subunit SecA [Methylococcus sp. EFPC2]|uniref:preprotein translocase subunit SecA n=1 Tax=Methylococcus sp. EFPC2 TaxID=2812648 RepID=UPI0019681217|nr:preprotein translocase subunit SecA [Methylococcus sp. EFPC2]QSA98384.1 preprotein translocase subunit SecA [Methylococcus sp. EFPC2]